MIDILDQVAAKRPLAWFRPTNVREFFILRLAQKLGEPVAASHYAQLAASHSDETLLLAYRRAVNHGNPPHDLGKRFHAELSTARPQDGHTQSDRLLSIKVERRCVAVAVFVGSRLDYHDVRTLSSQPQRAESSAIGFLTWLISSFDIESATLERMTNGNEIRRAVLNQAILNLLRTRAIPIWEVGKRELLDAYGYPPLGTRIELRQSAQAIIWAMFNTGNPDAQEIDAASLGLHVQTERLFLY